MLDKVRKYIQKNQLIKPTDKILVGISGGRDSISLALILKNLDYNISLAHCNFNLRGEESDTDERFVCDFAKKQQVNLHKISFETEKHAKTKGISIQMSARELRYDWFDKISDEFNYNYIAIGHNRDDIVETFFINLIRGTGLEGLSGIKAKNGKIVRPLLDISRKEIDNYINSNNINYREDSSNASTKYIRNKLRHTILPEFRNISKNFDKSMSENIERLYQTNQVYKNEITFKKSKLLVELSDRTKINIERLKQLNPLSTYLYEFLKDYQFTASTIDDIKNSLDSESGKVFYSKTHQIVKDREELILTTIQKKTTEEIFLGKENRIIHSPINLSIEVVGIKEFKMSKSKNIGALDIDKLSFPLRLRKWEHGDFFMPLGMNRMKKLSNFLIDSKVSMTDKNQTYVIQSKNDIAWIVGHRIDDRFKITKDTKNILLFKV
jgi:tRNA(Ile)-lysidine synthase